MTRDDYEEQKRRLAEQRRVLIELAESAYQQQVRALDTVWRMMSGEGAGELLPAAVPVAPQAAPAAPARRRRLRAGELYNDIVDALPRLPDPFIHFDISRALGYETDRGSLYRTLLELKGNGHLAVVELGSGTRPARYRWTHARVAAAEP
jgi:hypothetical protein